LFISRNWNWFLFFDESIEFFLFFTFFSLLFSVSNEIIKFSLLFFLHLFLSFSDFWFKSFFLFFLFFLTLFSFSNNISNRWFRLCNWFGFKGRFLVRCSSGWLRNTNFKTYSLFNLFFFSLFLFDFFLLTNRFSFPCFFDALKPDL